MTRLRLRAVIAALALALVVVVTGMWDEREQGRPAVRAWRHRRPAVPSDHEQRHRGSRPHQRLTAPSCAGGRRCSEKTWRAVQRSYAGTDRQKRGANARSTVCSHRRSQPINPEVQTQGRHATVGVDVRAATRFSATPSVVTITDYPASLFLVRTPAGWKLRHNSYRHYAHEPATPAPSRAVTRPPPELPRAGTCRAARPVAQPQDGRSP